MSASTRRYFLQASATGGLAAVASQFGFLKSLPRVSAQEARLPKGMVQYDPHMEQLVRLLEETPRERVLEEVAQRIHTGTSYQEVLAALLLAGVRNVQPRPSVGFKFHAVLVVNSCHLASLAGPDEDRWLPIFWAIDYFKSSQAAEARESGWHLAAVNESQVPTPEKARTAFQSAMDQWDVEQADAATAGIVRHLGGTEVFNLFCQYAARDFRSIGHKAIYLANAWRTLQVIGPDFSEPVLRSLTYALLMHTDEPNPSTSDLAPDRPWRQNAELVSKIPENWQSGSSSKEATQQLLSVARQDSAQGTASQAADILNGGVGAQSVWDAVFVGAGELLMRQPGIVGLHGLTTANAVHYLWQQAADEQLRKRLLLQACSFNALFRQSAQGRGDLRKETVFDVASTAPEHSDTEAVDEIMHDISTDKMQAAAKVRGFLANGGHPSEIVDAARRMVFLKGRDAHDYKYSSAVLEDFAHVSPEWRPQYLALSVFNLKGTEDRDSGLVERTRSALS